MAVRKKIRQCTEYKNDVTLEVYIVPVYHTTCLLNNRDTKTENKRILKYIVFENYMYMGILISEQYYIERVSKTLHHMIWCLMPLQQYISYIVAVSLISTLRK